MVVLSTNFDPEEVCCQQADQQIADHMVIAGLPVANQSQESRAAAPNVTPVIMPKICRIVIDVISLNEAREMQTGYSIDRGMILTPVKMPPIFAAPEHKDIKTLTPARTNRTVRMTSLTIRLNGRLLQFSKTSALCLQRFKVESDQLDILHDCESRSEKTGCIR